MTPRTLCALCALFLISCSSPGGDAQPVDGGELDSFPGADAPDALVFDDDSDSQEPWLSDVIEAVDGPEPDALPEVDATLPELPCQAVCTVCGDDDGCGGQCLDDALCDDGNVCTVDLCDPGSGCLNDPLALECDDGNPCTTDSCDPALGCQQTPVSAPCDDGNACTSLDSCQEGVCVSGGELACNDDNPCTDDSCDAQLGCLHTDNAAFCDDNSDCTTDDICSDGTCQGQGSLACDDGNPCTKDSCLGDGGCAYVEVTGACFDGNACTTGDMCTDGICVGSPVDCDDGNPCTDDSCNPASGCTYSNNTLPCSDGDACTLQDTCNSGQCSGVPKACGPFEVCQDGACLCTGSCGDKQCGVDPCGNSCGSCPAGWSCTPAGACEEPTATCPPKGPFGSNIGDILPDVTLTDCDGGIHHIHDLCDYNVSWFFSFAGW